MGFFKRVTLSLEQRVAKMSMLNWRGFLKGISGAVALVAAAPALRVADAVVPGPPPPRPSPKPDRRTTIFKRRDSAVAIKATAQGSLPVGVVADLPLPLPQGWIPCDGREVPKGMYPELENMLRTCGSVSFPYGDSVWSYNVPDFRGRAYT